jgi:hypothetical protein
MTSTLAPIDAKLADMTAHQLMDLYEELHATLGPHPIGWPIWAIREVRPDVADRLEVINRAIVAAL